MKTFLKVIFWIFCFPIMLMWVCIKGLIALPYDMEKSRRRKQRQIRVMTTGGSSYRRRR